MEKEWRGEGKWRRNGGERGEVEKEWRGERSERGEVEKEWRGERREGEREKRKADILKSPSILSFQSFPYIATQSKVEGTMQILFNEITKY